RWAYSYRLSRPSDQRCVNNTQLDRTSDREAGEHPPSTLVARSSQLTVIYETFFRLARPPRRSEPPRWPSPTRMTTHNRRDIGEIHADPQGTTAGRFRPSRTDAGNPGPA